MSLGKSEAVSHEKARAKAREIIGKVSLGEDPQATKTDRRIKDRRTMRALVDRYLEAKKTELRPRSLVETKRYLDDEVFPTAAQQAD